ncbi:hypothetical protein G9A89_010968 [Geosiphon pyriformis]|nr:hypothetical protein G9A89_010968 [Geosiphon pyriformis]
MHLKPLFTVLLAELLISLPLSYSQNTNTGSTGSTTILKFLEKNDKLSKLAEYFTDSSFKQVTDLLNRPGPFTLFAPSDDTWLFSKINIGNTTESLNRFRYLIVNGTVKSTDLNAGQEKLVPTFLTEYLAWLPNGTGQVLKINKTLDGKIGVNDGIATSVDNVVSNGVVHIIDNFPSPPLQFSENSDAPSQLQYLIDEANLTSAIDFTSGITIFAPPNSALEPLIEKSLNASFIRSTLLQHVVPKVLYASDLKDGNTFKTLNNSTITIQMPKNGGNLTVNGTQIIKGDLLLSNGVMHLIENLIGSGENSTENSKGKEKSSGGIRTSTGNLFGITEPTFLSEFHQLDICRPSRRKRSYAAAAAAADDDDDDDDEKIIKIFHLNQNCQPNLILNL